MITFQSMIKQTDPYSDKIYILSAWPEDWDADFRLDLKKNKNFCHSTAFPGCISFQNIKTKDFYYCEKTKIYTVGTTGKIFCRRMYGGGTTENERMDKSRPRSGRTN